MTRKEIFLDEMDQIIPWQELTATIEPFYPKPEGAGRRPKGAERMQCIHFLQHWFELSDPAAEEALYDSRATRQFVGIDLGIEPVFHAMKNQLGHTKVRHRGLDKNAHHLFIKCALVNMVLLKRRILRLSQAHCV